MDTRKIDLHVHSTHSDGARSVKEIAVVAKKDGIAAIALTDHDTVGGVAEAEREFKGQGIELIPGVELSTGYKGFRIDILGLFIDPESAEFAKLIGVLTGRRERRAETMAKGLAGLGFDIGFADVKVQQTGDVIGKPHVVKALLSKETNIARIKADMRTAGIEPSQPAIREFVFSAYLSRGKRAHVSDEQQLDPKMAIDAIHSAGGIAVIAHPCSEDYEISEDVFRELVRFGMDGVEMWGGAKSFDSLKWLRDISDELGLLKTEGSDYHGYGHNDHLGFHDVERTRPIRYEVMERLRDGMAARKE